METLLDFKKRILAMPFLDAVQVEPHPELIRELPDKRVDAKGKFVNVRYIPIEHVQMILDLIAVKYDVEIIAQGSMFSSVFVTKRLKIEYLSTRQISRDLVAEDIKKISVDGLGAMAVNNLNPVRMMLPAASSLAETNAAKNLGPLFGRDLNRGLSDEIIEPLKTCLDSTDLSNMLNLAKGKMSPQEIKNAQRAISENEPIGLRKLEKKLKSLLDVNNK